MYDDPSHILHQLPFIPSLPKAAKVVIGQDRRRFEHAKCLVIAVPQLLHGKDSGHVTYAR